jgi:hypothetical protein
MEKLLDLRNLLITCCNELWFSSAREICFSEDRQFRGYFMNI